MSHYAAKQQSQQQGPQQGQQQQGQQQAATVLRQEPSTWNWRMGQEGPGDRWAQQKAAADYAADMAWAAQPMPAAAAAAAAAASLLEVGSWAPTTAEAAAAVGTQLYGAALPTGS
eukprot:scaffold50508_cov33-Phaeocystis_antarctica.AAC.1